MKDEDTRYEAVRSRDGRFDGEFFFAVGTSGIYCRPSCPAVTPKRENVRFYASAAAAQGAGFRACRRCRPDAAPGSAEWNVRADAVGRAMPLDAPHGTLTHLFPEPAALTGAAGPLGALATALAEGTARLDVGADRDDTEAALLALPGLDPRTVAATPRTVAAIRTRALGDPDVAPPDETLPDAWRPWRSYALQHLRTADDREPATATAARRRPRARTQTRTQTWTLAQAQAHAQESALGQGDQS